MFTLSFKELDEKNRLLIKASKKGDIKLAKQVISEGAIINHQNYKTGSNPLITAVSNNHLEVVKLLVENNANVNLRTLLFKNNALLAASNYAKNLDIIKYLIENNANVNAKDIYNRDVCHYAAYSNELSVLKYFIEEHKLDPNTSDINGNTVLINAGYIGNFDMVKYLVEEKKLDLNTENNRGKTVLYSSVLSRNINIVKYLLEEKNIAANFKQEIYTAVKSPSFEIFKHLLSKIAPNEGNYQALLDELLYKTDASYLYLKISFNNNSKNSSYSKNDFKSDITEYCKIGKLLIDSNADIENNNITEDFIDSIKLLFPTNKSQAKAEFPDPFNFSQNETTEKCLGDSEISDTLT